MAEIQQSPESDQMYVEPYKNSIGIFGNTKPWKENIKDMGGKFNSKLTGQDGQKMVGWLIFDKERETEIREFVDQANSKQISALPQSGYNRGGNVPEKAVTATSGARARIATGPRLQYQTITYKVPLPYAGQGVTLTIPNDSERMMSVLTVSFNRQRSVDVITLQDGETEVTGAVVSGVWEIIDFGKDHSLTFH